MVGSIKTQDYSELWPMCHLPEEWKMSENAKLQKLFFSRNSQVKCSCPRIFISQTHEIFYQIFIKPTKMPNKTCCIINNSISRLFAPVPRCSDDKIKAFYWSLKTHNALSLINLVDSLNQSHRPCLVDEKIFD